MPAFRSKGKPGASPFRTDEFFLNHPVFSLDTFRRAGEQHGLTRTALAERVKYGLERGRLKLLAKGLYAVVPSGMPADRFSPDRFLVPLGLTADAVLAYHSALEILGLAHSVYRDVYYFSTRRRKALRLTDGRARALLPPKALRARESEDFGVETRERRGVKIQVTGVERTLVDCFAAPGYAGGLEEVMESGQAISVLDLDMLAAYLELLDERRLFAILGFFLEREASRLFVSPPLLERLERGRPASKIYLDKHQRGGRLLRRWNLIVPERWAPRVESGERV
jgi:predicted transcriptional regulator of viral defense system